MLAVIVGLIFIAFCVFACLPAGLSWGMDVVHFLKGFAPVFSAFVGVIAIVIGFADIRDKKEARKDEINAAREEENK